jgi:hypothetical protein
MVVPSLPSPFFCFVLEFLLLPNFTSLNADREVLALKRCLMLTRHDEVRLAELAENSGTLSDARRSEHAELEKRYRQFLVQGQERLQGSLRQLDVPQMYARPGAVRTLFARRERLWIVLFVVFMTRLVACFLLFQQGSPRAAPSTANVQHGPESKHVAHHSPQQKVSDYVAAAEFSLAALGLCVLFMWGEMRLRAMVRLIFLALLLLSEVAVGIYCAQGSSCARPPRWEQLLDARCLLALSNFLCSVCAAGLVLSGAPVQSAA